MAHQTGIEPTDKLKELITKALKGSLRFLKVNIEDEKLVPGKYSEPRQSWEDDLDAMVPPVLEDKKPCYIFFRLDERNAHQNYLWVFMSYTPDFAMVKEKMLYAATKATIRKAFSSGVIIDDIAATHKEELTLEGYKKHLESQKAAPPLTDAEHELKLLRESEDHADIGTGTRQSHLHGVSFPIQPEAIDVLKQFQQGSLGYLQLEVDVKRELILLDRTEVKVSADSLPTVIPESSPRYHFYRFEHTHEGDYQEAIIFIYSCPGFKSSIKERMLYSSCKEPLIAGIEEDLGIKVTKKVEIDSGSELSEQFLLTEVHPPTHAYKPKFMKPQPPGGRRRSKSPNRPGGLFNNGASNGDNGAAD